MSYNMAFDFLENAPESVIEVAWNTIRGRTDYPNSLYDEAKYPSNDPEQRMIDNSGNVDSKKEIVTPTEVNYHHSFSDLFPSPRQEK
jgi:hypothetical protein